MSEIISLVRGKNIIFSTDLNNAIRTADMIFISVNTPIKKGLGAVVQVIKMGRIMCKTDKEISEGHTIIEKSTLPVRTAQTIKDILLSSDSNLKIKVFLYY